MHKICEKKQQLLSKDIDIAIFFICISPFVVYIKYFTLFYRNETKDSETIK